MKAGIDYEAFNEEHGNADVSGKLIGFSLTVILDEEEAI